MAVLLPIKPQYCELIASGKKTIELRKSKPKDLIPPFKVYIYCTSIKHINLDNYVNLHRTTDGRIDDWHGKVIGEFICDEIEDMLTNILNGKGNEHIKRGSCLSGEQLNAYAKGKPLYGWHISDLIIYNKPKDLIEFGLKRPPQSWCYVKEREGNA